MNIKTLFIIPLILMGCSTKEQIKEQSDSLKVSTDNSLRDQMPYDSLPIDDNECVFNNDFKGLTTEWLNELEITDFVWREDLHGALIPKGQDSIFISQGGCAHFGTLVELRIRSKTPDISDSTFWMSKALELADNYKLNDYSDMIRKGKLRKFYGDNNNVSYEVSPDNQVDNLIYEGINIVSENGYIRLSISKYFN